MNSAVAKVLLIEDDPIDEMLVSHAFTASEECFNITQVSTIQGALRAIATTDFTVVIAELFLRASGTEESIRALGEMAKSIPTIVYTCFEGEKLEKWLLEIGFRAYLVKSVSGFRGLAEKVQFATGQVVGRDVAKEQRLNESPEGTIRRLLLALEACRNDLIAVAESN